MEKCECWPVRSFAERLDRSLAIKKLAFGGPMLTKHLKPVIVAASVAACGLGACTSLPPMQDPNTYSSLDCNAISHEREAVEANRSYHEDNSRSGFWDVFGAVMEGLAMGTGNASLASQQHTANAQLQQMHDDSKSNADAYANRTELLDKISAVRKCN